VAEVGVATALTFGFLRPRERAETPDGAEPAGEKSTPVAAHVLRWAPVAWRAVRLFTRW